MHRKKAFHIAVLLGCPLLLVALVRSNSQGDESRSASGNLFAAATVSDSDYVVVGDVGKIYVSHDAAKSWRLVPSGTKQALGSVCFADDRHGWATGQTGVVLHSGDGGNTWEAQRSGVEKYLLAVDFADAEDGVAVGEDSTVVVTSDGGKNWTLRPLESGSGSRQEINLFGVVMIDAQHFCIAGDGGRILSTEDAGNSWVEARSPLQDESGMETSVLYSLSYDSGTLYGVGLDGAFVVSRDRGKNWTRSEIGSRGTNLFAVEITGGIGFVAGPGGHVMRTTDGGSTWQVLDVPEPVTRVWLSGIALRKTRSGEVQGLIVGENGTIGQVVRGVVNW